VYSDDMSDDTTPGYGQCAQENAWCNRYFWVCWPLDHACETDNDCADHPDGEVCNTSTGQCGK